MNKCNLSCAGRSLPSALLFFLLLLQNPLENRIPLLRFADEAIGLLGLFLAVHRGLRQGGLKLRGTTIFMGVCLLGFSLTGLLGNVLWGYQPVKTVLTDFYTSLKFYLAMITGAALRNRAGKRWVPAARAAAFLFFLLLLADQALHLFPGNEMRYGIRAARLMYSHPTYLAGAVVFLLAVLTADYEKRNRVYIVMCLILLLVTLRGKAIAGTAIYCVCAYLLLYRRKPLRLGHLAAMGLAALAVAGRQFAYYYIELEGRSARSVLTQTAFRIARDYFPIGTGFGTYASHVAADPYSPVYVQYGFRYVYELRGGDVSFFDDTFWPIILGQTGMVGTIFYVLLLGLLFWRILQVRKAGIPAYTAGVFLFLYLMVSATSEPAFHNSVAIPLAVVLGNILSRKEACMA